jgi:hypothetical protein
MSSNFVIQGYISGGPAFAGASNIPVTITQYWKSGIHLNLAREVVDQNNIYYRHTAKNGWREYDKENKTYYDDGSRLFFTS